MEKTIYVGPEMVDCVGVAPQTCLLVRESPDGDWTLFYDTISGFEFEPGYVYELRISEEEVENPPADASSLQWTLIEVVDKSRSLPGVVWSLDAYMNAMGEEVDILPESRVTIEFKDGEIGGSAGCNSYFGTYSVEGRTLTVGDTGMTEMYCFPDELMAQESDYLAALGRAASYEIVDDQLSIMNSEGQTVLTYSVLEPVPLVGTVWRLQAYSDGQSGMMSTLAGTEITALFGEDGRLTGSAGCNSYSAAYEVDGNAITIGPAASTMMMCGEPGGIMEQEATYLAALQTASSYAIKIDTLLLDSGSNTLTFSVLEPAPLAGTPWQLEAYNNGKGGFTSVLLGAEITALFGEEGNLGGSAGCNNYKASYEVEGESIQIGPAASTRKMCHEPAGIMEQEAAYLAALEVAARYRIVGTRLELSSAEGSRVAAYQAREKSESPVDPVLGNVEYRSEWTQSGSAPLADGEYREQAAPGSATETVVKLTEHVVHGELNGQQAAVVVLVTDPGGSGTFYDLAVVMEKGGEPVNVATTLLGDRVQINSVDIAGNEIIVDMVNQGPEDAMCCPTQHVVQTYELRGEELVQMSSRVVEG